jgi:demethylmenaquinone methyltransferase/2-methoxy-6-polyprenyl-1,4-benzoquinol methylase
MAPTTGRGLDAHSLRNPVPEATVRRLFSEIAGPYDRLNRAISLGRDRAWRRRLVALSGVEPGATVADLGTGTGDLALEFARKVGPHGRVIALDLAVPMLRLAVAKSRAARGVPPRFLVASAAATGLADASCDVAAMAWVLRNVADRALAYAEVLRILRPGGRFLCIDMSRPSGLLPRAGFFLYRHLLLPLIVALGGGRARAYRYLARSTDRFPDRVALAREWQAAGFVDVQSHPLSLGAVCIHRGLKPVRGGGLS